MDTVVSSDPVVVTLEQMSITDLEEDSEELDVSPYWAERAAAFHQENPHIYRMLVRYALQVPKGKRIGIELLWNRMRWDFAVSTDHGGDFKLNQNYKAWYARHIMAREPELAGVFETRSRKKAA